MATIHIHRQLNSDTLPELRPLIGKTVDIIVRESGGPNTAPVTDDWTVMGESASNPLAGSVLRYDEPDEPAAPTDEWEANR